MGAEAGEKLPGAVGSAGRSAVRVLQAFGWPVSVVAGERGVRRVVLGKALARVDGVGRARYWAELAAGQLAEYFAGRRRRFTVPADLAGLSDFCRRVLEACAEIGFGEVRTYSAVAEAMGVGPTAARAVGRALATNPVPVIIPCHRVVRSDGSVGGFAAGGEWKKLLLRLESRCARGDGSEAARCGQQRSGGGFC